MSSQQVLDAVRQENATKKQGVLQKLFAVWFDAFVYNQIWEDPRVDLRALEIDENSRVLTISSGGCNALNYLLENPARVTAVDLNRHHIYLLNLKIGALRTLDSYEDFFAFFGAGRGEKTVENYFERIAPALDDATRRFWESRTFFGRLTGRRRIDFFREGGLYEHSRNGYFLRFFHKFAHLLGVRPEEVLKAQTKEEQLRLYEKHVAPFFDSLFIKAIGRLPVTLFGLGIPPQQHDELKKDLADGANLIDVYRARTKKLAVDYPITENYFAWQAFARRYDTENRRAVPEYLKEENFERLKANAGRIESVVGSVTDEIKNRPVGSFDRFVFLDAQDWMDAATLADLWQTIADRAAPTARIIFRTAGAASPVETALPENLRARFRYEEEFSRELFNEDRASIYGGFHLYVLI
ncbi:MAG: BtaA family protein [Acidobacteria bacterium]|nr:BtaA family protein [Acidobacteriota bacterium]